MKRQSVRRIGCLKCAILGLVSVFLTARSEIQLLPDAEPQRVFSGPQRAIETRWYNEGRVPVLLKINTRIYVASSATAAPIQQSPWKELQILPGQTVLEMARLDFPEVRGETWFLIQWSVETNLVLGTTRVLVYPEDLLKELGALAGPESLALADPLTQLRPALERAGVEFADLAQQDLSTFQGKLAIVESSSNQPRDSRTLIESMKAAARRGVGVVWIRPHRSATELSIPSFYWTREGKGTMVIARSALISNLGSSPTAQLALVQMAKLACHLGQSGNE